MKQDIDKELKEIAPFLSELKKQGEGYQVPFDFFETLPDTIMEQVQPKPEPVRQEPGVLERLGAFFQTLLQPRYAMAMVTAAVLVVSGLFLLRSPEAITGSSELLAAQISSEEMLNYVSENLDEFELEQLTEDLNIELNSSPEINADDLEQYIDEHILDEIDQTTLLEFL